MSKQRKKKSMYSRLPMIKALRLKRLGREEGIRAGRESNVETVKSELATNDREWEQRVKRIKDAHTKEVAELRTEIQELVDAVQEMRNSHADQLKLFRRVYRDKNTEADRMLDNLRDKLLAVDRRHFEINEFLSSFTADIERIKTKQEMQVVRNTEDSYGLKVIQNMQNRFSTLISNAAKHTGEARTLTRRDN